jgi:putative flippase GtrA
MLQVANIVSTGIGTLIRFICYRKWVFVHENAPAAVAHRANVERREALRTAA